MADETEPAPPPTPEPELAVELPEWDLLPPFEPLRRPDPS
jgi:hypothetical protein